MEPIAGTKNSGGGLSPINSLPAMPGGAERQLDLPDPSAQLGGLLNGQEPTASGTGSLLDIPATISARSTMRLVDVPGRAEKAAQSTSTMRITGLRLSSEPRGSCGATCSAPAS